MPFQVGNKEHLKRKNVGRPTDNRQEEVRQLLDSCWDENAKKATIKAVADAALLGDVNAAKLLFSYRFGTPPNGDEMKLREALEDQADTFFNAVERHLGKTDLSRLLEGLRADSEGGETKN